MTWSDFLTWAEQLTTAALSLKAALGWQAPHAGEGERPVEVRMVCAGGSEADALTVAADVRGGRWMASSKPSEEVIEGDRRSEKEWEVYLGVEAALDGTDLNAISRRWPSHASWWLGDQPSHTFDRPLPTSWPALANLHQKAYAHASTTVREWAATNLLNHIAQAAAEETTAEPKGEEAGAVGVPAAFMLTQLLPLVATASSSLAAAFATALPAYVHAMAVRCGAAAAAGFVESTLRACDEPAAAEPLLTALAASRCPDAPLLRPDGVRALSDLLRDVPSAATWQAGVNCLLSLASPSEVGLLAVSALVLAAPLERGVSRCFSPSCVWRWTFLLLLSSSSS